MFYQSFFCFSRDYKVLNTKAGGSVTANNAAPQNRSWREVALHQE